MFSSLCLKDTNLNHNGSGFSSKAVPHAVVQMVKNQCNFFFFTFDQLAVNEAVLIQHKMEEWQALFLQGIMFVVRARADHSIRVRRQV